MFVLPRSKLLRKVLGYFYANPEKKEYLQELARKLELDVGNLDKDLKKLEKQGIFLSERLGKAKYYFLNQEAPLFKEFQSIVNQTFGLKDGLRDSLGKVHGITRAFLYGSFAAETFDALSDIDVLIVGHYDTLALSRQLSRLEKKWGREINSVEMTSGEFSRREKEKDPFLKDLFKKPIIQLI